MSACPQGHNPGGMLQVEGFQAIRVGLRVAGALGDGLAKRNSEEASHAVEYLTFLVWKAKVLHMVGGAALVILEDAVREAGLLSARPEGSLQDQTCAVQTSRLPPGAGGRRLKRN